MNKEGGGDVQAPVGRVGVLDGARFVLAVLLGVFSRHVVPYAPCLSCFRFLERERVVD